MSLDITKLKPGDVIDYKFNIFPFHLEDPEPSMVANNIEFIYMAKKRIAIASNNNFLILEIREAVNFHYNLRNFYTIKLFVNSQIIWARITQIDINNFGFYLIK